jgi:hypothetical protein
MDINWIAESKKLLYIFNDYPALYHWLVSNRDRITDKNGIINRQTGTITFPNGNILWLGHAETDDDLYKYLSLEYDTVSGKYNERMKNRELSRKRF